MAVAGSKGYLAAKGNTNHDAINAVAFEKKNVAGAYPVWKDLCASLTRNAYGISADAWGDTPRTAGNAFHLVASKYIHTYYTAPAGVPVFWTGGASGAGHVAIADGKGNVYSNDFGPKGYIGDGRVRLIPVGAVSAHDANLKFQGWSEIFLGVRVYSL